MSDNYRIIIIDDNPAIHQDFIKILKADSSADLDDLKSKMFGEKKESSSSPLSSFDIDTASQGQEGVKLIKKAFIEGKPYSLAFVDIRMPPGWDGIETIKHIWEVNKDTQIVICTAYSDYSWEETIAHLGKTDNLLILKKPFDTVSVRQLACALTTKWQLTKESKKYTQELQQKVEDRTLSLQNSLSLIKSTFESSDEGILIVDNARNIIDYNQKFMSMFNISQALLDAKEEKQVLDFISNQLEPGCNFPIIVNQLKFDEVSVILLQFKNGNIFECYSQPHRLNEKIVGRILNFRDITKRAKLEEELKYQASHDPLTGLANRCKLMENLRLAIKTATLNQTKFAVVFLDLDRFKLINDSLSHSAGDELLRAVSERLKTVIRTEDTLARLGGDEFVILFMINQKKDVETKIQNILDLFFEPFDIGTRKVTLTTSVGVSIFPTDGNMPDVLLRGADVAMYRAKAQKGNAYQFFTSEMSMQSLAELDQEMELREALINNEFFLCYQPQLDLAAGKLIAVEALLRWKHPKKGVLLPLDFIPVAEETGLILPMSEWVIKEACKQNKAWQDAGFPPFRVAVNITAQQLKQQNLIEIVKNILDETNLDPKYLELELTENIILSNAEVIRVVTELKKLGVCIAVDDFGTGYSSLGFLHKIPLDRLKIDSSFIQHIHNKNDDEVIIRAVIAMAKNLNLEVLAEGVETETQMNFLKKYNCEDVQGFYFSKPLTINELENLLKNPSQLESLANLISNKS